MSSGFSGRYSQLHAVGQRFGKPGDTQLNTAQKLAHSPGAWACASLQLHKVNLQLYDKVSLHLRVVNLPLAYIYKQINLQLSNSYKKKSHSYMQLRSDTTVT